MEDRDNENESIFDRKNDGIRKPMRDGAANMGLLNNRVS